MSELNYLILVLGMSLVTYLPRMAPLVILTGKRLPEWLVEWLDLIPVAILASLLFPLLIVSETSGGIVFFQPELLSAIPVFIFAVKFKSLSLTVMFGMLLFWLLGNIM